MKEGYERCTVREVGCNPTSSGITRHNICARAVPVNAGLAKCAYFVRLGIWLMVATVCPLRVGIWLMVVRVCPPRVGVHVNARLARDALLFSCVWILAETPLRCAISVGVAPANV